MAYQIFALVPQHDFRDAFTGTKAYAMPNAYVTGELALKIAAREQNLPGNDVEYVVVPFGASPYDRAARIHRLVGPGSFTDCDIPF